MSCSRLVWLSASCSSSSGAEKGQRSLERTTLLSCSVDRTNLVQTTSQTGNTRAVAGRAASASLQTKQESRIRL